MRTYGVDKVKGQGNNTNLFSFVVYNITRAFKGDKKVYQTFCWDTCRDITVKLSYQGDADLYANEGSPPRIENSNCDNCLCKSRSSSSPDTCYITTDSK